MRELIPEQSFTVMSVVCHEWRRRVTKGLIKNWVNGLEKRCVKEGGKERYCWRAGVMSRNEREAEEGLLV